MSEPRRKKVLLVDDDPEVRSIFRTALAREDLETDEAVNGVAALEMIETHDYALVLLDLLMPAMGGGEVLERLRNVEPRPIVLVVSGASDVLIDSIDPSLIHGVVRKPFDPIEVAGLVKACVEIRTRRSLDTMCLLSMVASAQFFRWL
ncbi:MAG TPA: response regulator [Thermoanaerobaculia bacterium]|nr:response regulator [Thermoanaerobaculia bacterium]